MAEAGCRWGVSHHRPHTFSMPSSQGRLTHALGPRFKKDRRSSPRDILKDNLSVSVHKRYGWAWGDGEKNTYFCCPCIVMGDLPLSSFWSDFVLFQDILVLLYMTYMGARRTRKKYLRFDVFIRHLWRRHLCYFI